MEGICVNRGIYVGIAVVAVLALSFTAAAVDTGFESLNHELSEEGTVKTPAPLGGGGGGDGTTQTGDGGGLIDTPADDTETQSGDSSGPSLAQIVLSIALFTVGGVVIVYGLTRGEDVPVESERSEPDTAGERATDENTSFAADVSPTNDVYRIWCQFHTEIQPTSTTASPAEIAGIAIEKGFDEQTVWSLTRLFCAVRYGRTSPTEEREKRARTLGKTLGIVADETRIAGTQTTETLHADTAGDD